MFFLATVLPKEKELQHSQSGICPACGAFGSYRVWMRYSCLALFFIPLFKWGKQYFVEMSCCGAVFSLNPQVGAAVAKGEAVEILPEDLQLLDGGQKRCPHCGRTLEGNFPYCPHCGGKQ